MVRNKSIKLRRKIQRPLNRQKWRRQEGFYHNKTSQHFFLGTAKRGDALSGHDMTTHPSRTSQGKPKKKYMKLFKNPNPNYMRDSYIDKKLRINVKIYFEDSRNKRLTVKRGWKLAKTDVRRIKRLDKKQIKNPHNSV